MRDGRSSEPHHRARFARAVAETGRWMFFFGARRLGPLGIAFTAYRLWRRLSPSQKAAMKNRAETVIVKVRGDRVTARPIAHPTGSPTGDASRGDAVSDVVAGAATADEIMPSDLTSPGTVADPELEQRRAQEALVREKESRATEETKFEELRRQQEAERPKLAAAIDEPSPPTDATR